MSGQLNNHFLSSLSHHNRPSQRKTQASLKAILAGHSETYHHRTMLQWYLFQHDSHAVYPTDRLLSNKFNEVVLRVN